MLFHADHKKAVNVIDPVKKTQFGLTEEFHHHESTRENFS